MTADFQLLRDYTRDRSQEAFAELVRRHVDLVYSAALRQVRSSQLAEEVAQSVFTDLAGAAETLNPDTILTAWLYQVTRRTAIDVVRRESRRQARERLAVEMAAMNTATDWTQIEPILDDAMEALEESDRAAILLRYFENKSLHEVGETLGTSDDAAQKRVSRAVERLREFFSKRGVAIGASGLVVVVSANAVQAAPVALTTTISTAAVLAGTTIHTSTAVATTKVIATTILQKASLIATITLAAAAAIYELRQATQLRGHVQALERQQVSLMEQIQQLQRERDEAKSRLVTIQDALPASSPDDGELLRLRGEVTQLQGALAKQSGSINPEVKQSQSNTSGTHYYYNYAPWRAAMRSKLTKMDEQLGLSAEQHESISEILTNMFAKDPEGQIKATLSPEQQAVYHQFREEQATVTTRSSVDAEVAKMQLGLGLTTEQRQKTLSTLFDVELTDRIAKLDDTIPNDPETSWAQDVSRTEHLYQMKYNALTNILSAAQLENLRAWQSDDLQQMKQRIAQTRKTLPSQ